MAKAAAMITVRISGLFLKVHGKGSPHMRREVLRQVIRSAMPRSGWGKEDLDAALKGMRVQQASQVGDDLRFYVARGLPDGIPLEDFARGN